MNLARRSFLKGGVSLFALQSLGSVAQANPQTIANDVNDELYSVYRRGLINRHIARNGCLLQQVWLVESAPKEGVASDWDVIARTSEEHHVDEAGARIGTFTMTASPLLLSVDTPERPEPEPLVVGGGDNPLLEGGLALMCFSIEMLEGEAVLVSSRSTAKRLFDFILASEAVKPGSSDGWGLLLRRRNWWSMPAPASLDEYCGVLVGAWFYLQAMQKIGDEGEQERIRGYLGRLGKTLAEHDYLVPLMGFQDTYGLTVHAQTGRDVWAFQFPVTRIFKSALGVSHLAETTIPDERGGLFESLIGLSPRGLFEWILDKAHTVSAVGQIFGSGQQFYNQTMIVHALLMLFVTRPTPFVRREVWEQAREFFAGSLANGGLRNPYFGLVWDAWARERGDAFAGDVPSKMYEPVRTPQDVLFRDLPMREPQVPAGKSDPNPPPYRIDVRNGARRFLWGRTFLSNAPWNVTVGELRSAGIDPTGSPEEVGFAIIGRWDQVAASNKDSYTIRVRINDIPGEIGPPEISTARDDRMAASDAYYDPKTDRGFYLEGSGLRYMVCRMLGVFLGVMDLPQIDERGIGVLPVDGPSAGAFRRHVSLWPRNVRRTITVARRERGSGRGDYDIVYPREEGRLQEMRQRNTQLGRPVAPVRMFGDDREYDAAAMIFSRYGNPEVIARDGDNLFHFFRRGVTWSNGFKISGDVKGVPGFIQSNFGQFGNFEVVVPREGGGFWHFWRNNDDAAEPWISNRFGDDGLRAEAVALIQSNYGNLEIVYRDDNRLYHMWRDGVSNTWSAPRLITTNVRGAPAFVQSSGGQRGHFEVIVPARGRGLRHFFRDNDDPSEPWIENRKLTGHLREDGGDFDGAAMIERTDAGILDVYAVTDGGRFHYFRRTVSKRGKGPHDLKLSPLERHLPSGGAPVALVSLSNRGEETLRNLIAEVEIEGATRTARWSELPPGTEGEPKTLSFPPVTCSSRRSIPMQATFRLGARVVGTRRASFVCLGGSPVP